MKMVRDLLGRSGIIVLAVFAMGSLTGGSLFASSMPVSDNASVVSAPSDPKGGQGGNSGNVSGGQQGSQQGKTNNAGGNGGGNDKANGNADSQADKGNGGGNGGNPNVRDQPLPPSDKGTGANQSGPYDPNKTDFPKASGNGNGNGKAVGKPEAGTVGNADNKNPPGQVAKAEAGTPGGYECKNNGNGQGNPAHTAIAPCSTGTGGTGTTTDPGDGKDQPGDDKGKPGDGKPGDGIKGGSTDQGAAGSGDPNKDKQGDSDSGKGKAGGEGTELGKVDPGSIGNSQAGGNAGSSSGSGSGEQEVSGQAGLSAGGSMPEVLGQQALSPEEMEGLLGGADGMSGTAGLGAGIGYAAPGTLPYTGEADEASTVPALWMAAGLVLMAGGMLLRRASSAAWVTNR